MSALQFSPSTSVGPDTSMAHEVERLQAIIVEQLHIAGVRLPDAASIAIADVILAEALRISLRWLETETSLR